MKPEDPPQFFVPVTESHTESERVWHAIRDFSANSKGWEATNRRVYSVAFRHDGELFHATVGEILAPVGEVVCAILEVETCWMVCTPNRGVIRGGPILIGIPESVVDFAPSVPQVEPE
jgi:hypothetical protein